MKSEKALQLIAEEQRFDESADRLTRIIQELSPADKDELDLDYLELISAAGNGLSYDQFLKIAKNDSGNHGKR